jgi:hypothetical protein
MLYTGRMYFGAIILIVAFVVISCRLGFGPVPVDPRKAKQNTEAVQGQNGRGFGQPQNGSNPIVWPWWR